MMPVPETEPAYQRSRSAAGQLSTQLSRHQDTLSRTVLAVLKTAAYQQLKAEAMQACPHPLPGPEPPDADGAITKKLTEIISKQYPGWQPAPAPLRLQSSPGTALSATPFLPLAPQEITPQQVQEFKAEMKKRMQQPRPWQYPVIWNLPSGAGGA